MPSFTRTGLIPAITAALLLSTAIAGSAAAETLTEALAKAYETNPQILSERAGQRATDEEVPQALAHWRPTVTFSGEAGKERIDANTGNQNRKPSTLEFDVKQPLYRGGRTEADTKRAEATVKAGQAQVTSTEQTVLLAAVQAYMNVVRDLALLELNRNNEQRLQRQLQAAQDRFRVGEITRTDVAQAEAALAGATAARIQAEGAVVSSRATYRTVIGDMPGTLTKQIPPLDLPSSEAAAQSEARETNPDVVRARYRVDAARNSIDLVRGELLPSLNLEGTLTKEEDTTAEGSQRDTASLLATLTVPLYQAGDVYSRLRAAKETLGQNLDDYDNQIRTAVEQATSAWNTLQTTRAAVRSFQSQVRANEIALDGVQRENLVGSRTVLDVLNAEQTLLTSRADLVSAQRDEVVAQFQLLSAVGGLTARNLKLPVTLYDTEKNYREVRDKWFGAEKPKLPDKP